MADARVMHDAAPAAVLHALVDDADWPASDVPPLLHAIVDDRSRASAWHELSGSVLPEGAATAATAPAVPVLAGIAAWRDHPSRIEAIRLLREIASGTRHRDATLHASTVAASEPLIARWHDEREPIRRVLLLLLSAMPDDLLVRHVALSDDELDADHHEAFAIITSGGPTSEEEFDLVCDFTDWAMGI
jgi:hypothetical protein